MWSWLLPFVFCAPWIVAIAWVWRRVPDDGWLPPSMGSQLLRRV